MRCSSQPTQSRSALVVRVHERLTKRGGDARILLMRQAVPEGEGRRDIEADHLRVALAYDAGEAVILRLALRVPPLRIEVAEAVAVERQPLHAAVRAAGENEDRAAAGGHRRFREDRHDNRVFVILAGGDDPHIETLARHQGGDECVEAMLEPVVAHHGPRPQRQDTLAQRGHEGVPVIGDGRVAHHRSSILFAYGE